MAFLSEAGIETTLLDQLRALGYSIEREEDIGPDGHRPERESHDEVVLRRRFEDAVALLNPGMPPKAATDEDFSVVRRGQAAGTAPAQAPQPRRHHFRGLSGQFRESHALSPVGSYRTVRAPDQRLHLEARAFRGERGFAEQFLPRGAPGLRPLKRWLSITDQLELLQARGLHVDDRVAAMDYLERLGYYRLSGYWYPLRRIDEAASQAQGKPVRLDEFVPGSRFEDVVRLYVFDKRLRLLALDALERIEMAVRVDVAYLLGQQDPLAHENPDCLHGNFTKKRISNGPDKGKTPHQVWLERYRSLLHRARKEPFAAHHMQHYGALPIWVAIEVWDFGLLSKLFAGMKYEDQKSIARMYGAPDGKAFAQWLRSLNFIRNVSAHHSRLWNVNVLELSPVPNDWPRELRRNRPLFYFCLMQRLLQVICPNSSWGQRLVRLLRTEFPGAFSLTEFGVFPGWEDWPLWESGGHK